MDTEVFTGHHCPRCGTTTSLSASIGGPLCCPGCGGPMQAAPAGPRVDVPANVQCGSCGSRFEPMTIVDNNPLHCPSCGKPL